MSSVLPPPLPGDDEVGPAELDMGGLGVHPADLDEDAQGLAHQGVKRPTRATLAKLRGYWRSQECRHYFLHPSHAADDSARVDLDGAGLVVHPTDPEKNTRGLSDKGDKGQKLELIARLQDSWRRQN